MYLLVGLGNPGASYALNRHNIGFMAADELARIFRFSSPRAKFQSEVMEGDIAGQKILLLKPQTYMNHSGRAVSEAVQFYKIPQENVIVMHDELALPLSKLRMKQGGGHGGHNGLRDIDKAIGPDYWRLRIGIDHPGDKDLVHDYVLGNFSKAEQKDVEKIVQAITDQFPLFFTQSAEAMMSKIALALTPPKVKSVREVAPLGAERAAEKTDANHQNPESSKGTGHKQKEN